ncbi:MAG TPA: hypothetical protein VIM12_05765 [Noviherbaspirillum sp.]|jgi:hypothetical protein|uniref:hypothetical protein n=1 Tax=Noviherbaspirillum sp. TaxID=1926288 RepID=UPI002F949D76
MFETAYFALRNHFLARPGEEFTLQQAHELWNDPYGPQQPVHLTEKALEALERQGTVRMRDTFYYFG